ncbi:hypothetical protein AVEN_50382-1 [Araneus ventricosus]|uniref:Parvovirus non-structural protein 1 helicase domain-containing protein n=1 Tax=Araneus ventricosus TaxID=182803 RepID=A0A4Y2UUQ1_ARAVE|nr:hypothetical protein AVEN_50382-1 [Araneus ventricosus]
MDTQFDYRAICFGIKDGKSFDDCLVFKKKLKLRTVLISEHPAGDEECEYRELHYHGVVEHPHKYRFDSDRIFNELKPLCTFFKSELCKLPINFIAYLHIPPRQIVFENELPNSDIRCLQAQVTPELIEEVKARRENKTKVKIESSGDIMQLKEWIILTRCFSPTELLNEMYKRPSLKKEFEIIYCKRTYDSNFKKALNFAVQETLDKFYLDLCAEYVDEKNECMSPCASADVVEKWCKFQRIDPGEFCRTIIDLMDRKHRKLNCVVLQGAPNSGKTFICKSIEKGSVFFAEVTQAVAGYSFMWMDCINKRFISINEPFFTDSAIEELKKVLEGTGCRVKCKGKGDEYLRPTPVMITTNADVWCQCPAAQPAIQARCLKIFDKLEPCPFLKFVDKDLHPRWLGILSLRYARQVPGPIEFDDSDECGSPSPPPDTAARAPKTGWWGNFFAGIISAKGTLRGLPGSDYLPGEGYPNVQVPKRPLEQTPPDSIEPVNKPPEKKANREEYGGQTVKKNLSEQFKEMGSRNKPGGSGSNELAAHTDPTPQSVDSGQGGGAVDSDVQMTPVHTGKQIVFFQKLFWHYFTIPVTYSQSPTGEDDDILHGFSTIPYQHICSSLTPRNWQYLNTAAKRFRVLTFGFKASHFTPFKNDIDATGGAVGPKITYMVNSSLQTFIDKGYILPVNTGLSLPNSNMMFPIANQTDAQLRQVSWKKNMVVPSWTANTSYTAYTNSGLIPPFSIENSNEFEILSNDGIFSFEHTLKPHELQWRSGIYPTNANKTNNPEWAANPLGRWDGVFGEKQSADEPNWSRWQQRVINPIRPAPDCLIRPNLLFDVKKELDQIWYQCCIKYHSWVEIDMNDCYNNPIWPTIFDKPNTDNVVDIFNTSASRLVKDAELQCSGGNPIPMVSGPKKQSLVL